MVVSFRVFLVALAVTWLFLLTLLVLGSVPFSSGGQTVCFLMSGVFFGFPIMGGF